MATSKRRTEQLSAFTEIDTGGAFEIEWQSGSPALRITTDENLLSYVESDVSGDTLYLAHSRPHLANAWNQSHHLQPNESSRKDPRRRKAYRKTDQRTHVCS